MATIAVTLEASTFAEVVRLRLFQRGQTETVAAREMGMSRSTLCRILQGDGFATKWIIPLALWGGLNAGQVWAMLEAEAGAL